MKLIKNNFQLGEIRPPPVFLDCPNVVLLKQRTLFGEQFDPILSF